jgi:hypothetical protein
LSDFKVEREKIDFRKSWKGKIVDFFHDKKMRQCVVAGFRLWHPVGNTSGHKLESVFIGFFILTPSKKNTIITFQF